MAIFKIESEKELSYGKVQCVGEQLQEPQSFIPHQGISFANDPYCYIGEVTGRNRIKLQLGVEGIPIESMVVEDEAINNHKILKKAVCFIPDEESPTWRLGEIMEIAELSLD